MGVGSLLRIRGWQRVGRVIRQWECIVLYCTVGSLVDKYSACACMSSCCLYTYHSILCSMYVSIQFCICVCVTVCLLVWYCKSSVRADTSYRWQQFKFSSMCISRCVIACLYIVCIVYPNISSPLVNIFVCTYRVYCIVLCHTFMCICSICMHKCWLVC